jgi:hypothetical protein
MQKFWLVVPPLVGLTDAETGEALEQLRIGSVAVAVYAPAGTEIE